MKVTEAEVIVAMTDEQALEYLCWCQQERMAGRLTDEALGLVPGSEIKIMIISKKIPWDSERIMGKNLFAVALTPAAAKSQGLLDAVRRRIYSRWLGADIPEGLPRPRMIMIKA